jgi:lactoylglutathione lyase
MARMVGINHVALEVGDVEEAVAFYGGIFDLKLRGRTRGMALAESGATGGETGRHFGLVVDDVARVRQALQDAGVELQPSRGLRFRDPWGNLVEVVQYSEVQFTKAPPVLAGMGLEELGKSESARKELREKGLL